MAIEKLKDPIELFDKWFQEANDHPEIADATAMFLATADKNARPSLRAVLLKAYDYKGFVFYTNCESQKGKELLQNPQAALTFYWEVLGKQIRIQGKVESVSESEADSYFHSRPWKSKIGAWASQQSRPMKNKHQLKKNVAKFMTKYAMKKIPRPAYWSGFRVLPESIEFWQEGAYRLHQRLVYKKNSTYKSIENKTISVDKNPLPPKKQIWDIKRLFP